MTKTRAPSIKSLITFAHHLADLSGPAILPHFRRQTSVENKAGKNGFDPVTAADRAAEKVITRAIGREYDEHGIVGEEFGDKHGEGRYRWVVDPIDGTRAFIMGQPLWGTLIGLLDGEEAVLGMMDQPFTAERVWSDRRVSRWRTADGKVRRMQTRSCRRLGDAVLSTTHPDLFAAGEEMEGFLSAKAEARMTRYGGDCYAYCLLAAGHIDAIIEAGLKPFDIVALIPIIEAAGGKVSAWDGGPATSGGRIVAAGDAKLHADLVRRLAG